MVNVYTSFMQQIWINICMLRTAIENELSHSLCSLWFIVQRQKLQVVLKQNFVSKMKKSNTVPRVCAGEAIYG